jgi:hypothetical protein
METEPDLESLSHAITSMRSSMSMMHVTKSSIGSDWIAAQILYGTQLCKIKWMLIWQKKIEKEMQLSGNLSSENDGGEMEMNPGALGRHVKEHLADSICGDTQRTIYLRSSRQKSPCEKRKSILCSTVLVT